MTKLTEEQDKRFGAIANEVLENFGLESLREMDEHDMNTQEPDCPEYGEDEVLGTL